MNKTDGGSAQRTGIMFLAVILFLCLKLLLEDIMSAGGWNEVDILPLARHYVAPNWVTGDWYLNQPAGYRMLFQTLFGRLAVAWGFLATSLVGRLICYGLVASGLTLIGRKLGLSLPLLLLAVVLFLTEQSLAAGEWLVGGLEAKSVAYGLIMLAISLMLDGRYLWMALLLGLATSFHVLVGGWAFLAVLTWLILKPRLRLINIQYLGLVLLLYLAASTFAIGAVAKQLFDITPTGSIPPSFIYVFLRLSHHLNPLSWDSGWWLKPIIYLLVLAISISLLWRKRQIIPPEQYTACIGLAEFTIISFIPFVLGLVVAPFDSQGSLLQYYPFRLGDVILPLNTCLLFASALEQTFSGRSRRLLLLICLVVLSWQLSQQAVDFKNQLVTLRQFPGVEQRIDPQWQALCTWVRTHTAQDALVVSFPGKFNDFTWLAERPTVAKFKLLPQNKAGIIAWYNRISDLSGNADLVPTNFRTRKDNNLQIKTQLQASYDRLTTAQVKSLMNKYNADYFIAQSQQQLDLPIAYQNSLYVLYRAG